MAPVKILFLVNTLRVGGFERDVTMLCEHIDMKRFRPEVWVLCGGGQFEDRVLTAGIRVRDFGRRSSRNPVFACRFAYAISRSRAKLIHAFLPTIATYAALARTCFGVRSPMVLSIGQSQTIAFERWMFRWCSRTFDWLVANSRSAAELGQSLGFSPNRISLIPNGHDIDSQPSAINRKAVRASVGVAEDERMLLCVSRLVDTKRVADAVAALDLLGDSRAKLVIVGDGPQRAVLEDEVARRALKQKVVLAGQRNDVPNLMQAADLFLFPSETEGLPNALIEACLAGLPAVACKVRGVVDVVTDGESAVLVPPRHPADLASAIRNLLANPAEASRLAASAQSRARRNYSIDQSLSALYDVYERLLDYGQGGRDKPRRRDMWSVICG
jgi:glycosyltransferase involved in cell wall biosynthesis